MSSEQAPSVRPRTSGCMSCFIIGVALIGVSIILLSIAGTILFDWEFPISGRESAAVGKSLHAMQLEPITLNAEPVTLADVSGKVALVNFWATWCGFCRIELPEIAEIYEKYRHEPDFRLLPVACDEEDFDRLSTDSRLLLQDLDLAIPCYADPRGITRGAFLRADNSGGLSLPTTFVIDRKGVIRGVWIGYSPGHIEKMNELIAVLLAEQMSDIPAKQFE